jgi:hypothetical protein
MLPWAGKKLMLADLVGTLLTKIMFIPFLLG